MDDRKKFTWLDDIGIFGTQDMTPEEREADEKRADKYFADKKKKRKAAQAARSNRAERAKKR
jgi:hypothetical protein